MLNAEQLELFEKVESFTEQTQLVSESEVKEELQIVVEEFLKKEEICNVTMSTRGTSCCYPL